MKIAVIGHKRVPSREGGIEKTVEKQMLRMRDRGHEVVFYNRSGHNIFGAQYDAALPAPEGEGARSPFSDAWKDLHGVTIRTVFTPKGKAGVPVYSFLATFKAVRDKCDILYYHGSGSCVMIPLAGVFGKKTAAMLHGIDSRRAKWKRFGRKYLELGERFAAEKADACFVLSEHMRDYIKETYGADTILTFNGAEAPKERPESGSGVSGRFGLTKDGYVLTLVRIVPEKGLHYLIRAFKKCRTDKKLVIAGGVDPACRDYYRRLTELAGDDERILFTGFIEEPDVTELYRNAYLFVLPSDLEGMAHSLLEAMAAGCACLVSDIPENTGVLGEYGKSFRKGSTKDLYEQLSALLKDPEAVEKMRDGVSEHVLSTYHWEACTDQIEQVFRGICGES